MHGLNYNAATFTVLPCENQTDYDQLLQSLQEEQDPQDTVEELLVISMAQHRWLLDRATRLQETTFDPQTGQVADQKLFSLYLRYATTHERAFHKCLNDLLKLRAAEEKSQIGFESKKRQQESHEAEVRLTNARAAASEIETEVRSTMEAPLPGHARIPFEDLKAAFCATLRDLNRNVGEKLSKEAA